ncbi:MAG: HAMP domain-containing histidine kinase [Deltaproteobacteria bacterium]|nr:HAMP domain-containing histidine kinase [Deltaproteobacteria bacterium]
MSLTGAIVTTAVGILLPVILSTTVGIIAIATGNGTEWTLFGVLVVSFAAAAIGGGVIVTVLLSKKHVIGRQQADFLANITHELRTPLTAIRMYAQTIEMGRLEGKPELLEQASKTILRETEWLESMIDQVLTWRAASRDMNILDKKMKPIKETVKHSVERFKRMVPDDEVEFTYELKSESTIYHDERAVHSIVINLLVNAYKYTGTLKKITLKLFDEGDNTLLTVKDNGIGIHESELHKIFDPFYRVDSRLRSKASGAGLGLAIVKHNAVLHDAEVSVKSEENAGTEFTVSFIKSINPEKK